MTPSFRNWSLVDIIRVPARPQTRCEHNNCNLPLRWAFIVAQGDAAMVVGSECVRAVTHVCDGELAIRALSSGKWKQRRSYWWKRIGSRMWRIGRYKQSEGWWIMYGPSVAKHMTPVNEVFATMDDAKLAAVMLAATTGVRQ